MTIKDSPCCGKKCFSTFANVPLDTGSCMAFSAELLCAAEWALRGYYCIDEFDLSRIAQEWVPLCIVFLVSIPQKLLHWCHLTVLLAIPRSFPPRFGFLALYHLHHLVRGDALFYYRYGHCENGELFHFYQFTTAQNSAQHKCQRIGNGSSGQNACQPPNPRADQHGGDVE